MYTQKILEAFTNEEYTLAHQLLSTRVAFMMGRKFEEGDWSEVYCKSKDIQPQGWSNLNIDIINGNQGIEHKMLCYRNGNILSACGCTFMHPSATRSIRLPSLDIDPNDAMTDILGQYKEFLLTRQNKILENSQYNEADMRTGWLLWQDNLHQFLYFEEKTHIPNPDDYIAQWVENPSKGIRKSSKNLWIYEKDSGRKRFSVTTSAGAKIQPYFDVPAIGTKGLYHFVVIGEKIMSDTVRIWITKQTYLNLYTLLQGDLSKSNISNIIINVSKEIKDDPSIVTCDYEKAFPILISTEAYNELKTSLPGINDDHSIQLLIGYLSSKSEKNYQ